MSLDLLHGLVLEDGRRWGAVAANFQREDAAAILDGDAVQRRHFLTRPRGASKTTDLAAVVLVALLEQLPAGAQAYGVAADREQAQLLLAEIAGFVRRSRLGGAVQLDSSRATTNRGTSFTALPADDAGAYGLRPHFVVVDELCQWNTSGRPQRMWEAIYSAVPKVQGCRLVVISTAGDPAHWSRRIFDSACRERLWRVHEVPGPCPWVSPADLAEQRRMLTDSQFARLHENRWTAAEDRLTTPQDLAGCVGHEGPLDWQDGHVYAVGVDLGLKNDRTVVSVCHSVRSPGVSPQIVLDRQLVWAGSKRRPVSLAEVEATLRHVQAAYGQPTFVVDPWQAATLVQNLKANRAKVEEFTFSQSSIGRLAQRLYLLLRDGSLVLPDDLELLDELANVRLRETNPGVFRMDHDRGRHDDRAISLALAANWLLEGPKRRLLRYGGVVEYLAKPEPVSHQSPQPLFGDEDEETFPGLRGYFNS